jgi:predicted metalloprotease with PDZ domain
MKRLPTAAAAAALITSICAHAASPGPVPLVAPPAIEAPQDRAFPGEITLAVDVTDVARRIVHVRERIRGVSPDTVLLFPKWLPGNHSPTGPIERMAGLHISAGGVPLAWSRDPVDMYAFHVPVPAGAGAIEIDFDYLAPTSGKVDRLEMSREFLTLDWNTVVLYPAGYFARQIPVAATVRIPAGWTLASALEPGGVDEAGTRFASTSLETLMDSPVFAGHYAARHELAPPGAAPVHLDLFADRPELLAAKPEHIAAFRSLVEQAQRLYGSHHYAHYDFLYGLSDQVAGKGLEHHQSSEDINTPTGFTEWDKTAPGRDLLPHEYTHSWNGKFRRPADLWTPNYNVPMQDSLLWVYEGQTEYWGNVLTARSGLWNRQQALDELATVAAYYDMEAGRLWRSLQDTTNAPIINHHRPSSWPDWERGRDYYDEGVLIWLDADTLIRERSRGRRSLDDFARAFFGVNDGSTTVLTYTLDDVVKTLNGIEANDWAGFFKKRLSSTGEPAPLDGLRRGGYKLVFTDKPSDFEKSVDAERKHTNLFYSLGLAIDNKDGAIAAVAWNSPAFNAGLTESTQILAVNGLAYSSDVLTDAVRAAQTSKAPIELIVKNGDHFLTARIDYTGGLRYPHLEKIGTGPALLDEIFTARKN